MKNYFLSNYKFVFVYCFAPLILFSCDIFFTKETYFTDFEKFISITEKNCKEYNQEDWDNSDIEYTQFTEDLYKKVYSELNESDQQRIGKLKARYEKAKFKYKLKNTIHSIKDGIQQTVGTIEELLDSTTNN